MSMWGELPHLSERQAAEGGRDVSSQAEPPGALLPPRGDPCHAGGGVNCKLQRFWVKGPMRPAKDISLGQGVGPFVQGVGV